MVSIQCDIHAFSTREDIQVRDTDFSCFKYFDKSVQKVQGDRPYSQDKASFAAGRGQKWFLENKRPERLRTALKEFEELVSENSIVFCKWRSSKFLQLVVQNGVIVGIWLNKLGDLLRISFDKYLVGKLLDHVTDFCFTSKCIVVAYLESRVSVVTFGRSVEFLKCDSLVQWEPRIHTLDLYSPPGRRLDRKIVLSTDCQQLVIWWPIGSQEVFPWSPQLKEEDRANLILFSLKAAEPRLVAFHRTGTDPLYFRFLSDGNTLHYLAQAQEGAKRGETQLENTILAVEHQKHIRKRVSRCVSLSGCITCHALVPNSDNVLLGSSDGTIFTFDQIENKVDNQVKAGFIANSLICHPDGAIFFAISEKGLVQCFDIALTPIQLCFPNEEQVTGNVLDLGLYFRNPVVLKGGCWYQNEKDTKESSLVESVMDYNFFLLRFQGGPLALLRLNGGVYTGGRIGPLQIVGQYLKYNLYHQVLLFLSQLSWVYSGQAVLMCLTTAFNAFLKLPFTREKECLLEMCLGLFHAPAKTISDEVRDEFSEAVRDLTRRFFHHLVRHNQLIKGFQLAVDINDYDLFMDIHHSAARRSIPDLAHAALIKAKAAYNKVNSEPESRCNSSQSIPTPFQLFTSPDGMHPGKPATFHKTTAAKKISTHEFKSNEFEDASGNKSLKYDSIVTLPFSQDASLGGTRSRLIAEVPPPDPHQAMPPIKEVTNPSANTSTFHSSPYVYRHKQDENFVTNLSTEEYNIHPASQLQVSDHQNYKEHSYFNTQIQIDQPKMSTFPRQRQPDKPPPPYPQEQLEYRSPEEDYKYDMRTPPSYKPPPITHRPPHPSHQPPAGKEDIKVIHFGVV
jgi:WD40 repeat protein